MKRAARTVFAAGFTCLVGLVACSAPAVTAAATPAPEPVPEPTTAPADASIDAAPILDPAPLPSPEDLAGSEPAPPASAHGSVSGTAFWLGPSPDYQEDRPLHFGSAHPRDWQGADDAEYWGLEGVFVSATPLDPNAPGGRVPDALDWPDRDSFICYRTKDCAPHLNVVRGDHFTISNHRTQALSLQFVAGDRVRMSVPVAAKQQDVEIDLAGLDHGTFEIVDAKSKLRIGWLVHAGVDDHVTGATSGNCRYNLDLAPGRYRIVAWNPYLTPFEAEATVRPGIITRVNPVFTADDLRE